MGGVPGPNKVAVKVYQAEAEILLYEEEMEFESLGGGEYTKLALKTRVNLEPKLVYDVRVMMLAGPDKFLVCGKLGKTLVQVGNVAVTFSSSPYSINGTDVYQGQIPSIYLCV